MPTGDDIARASPDLMGTPYSKLDCQAYVEAVLAQLGLKKNLPGSNAWYRLLMKEGWVGSPEECKAKFGTIPFGAFLFIHAMDGKEPEKYKADGIGNASHIGIYTGMTGSKMCELARQSGVKNPDQYNFGNGAMNSSSSHGCVCTSKFSGKSIRGGWNKIGLWKSIDYGRDINRILSGKNEVVELGQYKVVGGKLNLREQPSVSSERLCQIPDGEILTVTDEAGEWAKTSYNGMTGWVKAEYLEPVGNDADTVTVSRKTLQAMYDTLGSILRG